MDDGVTVSELGIDLSGEAGVNIPQSREIETKQGELLAKLQPDRYLGSGQKMMCFEDPDDSGQVLLIPFANHLGRESMLNLATSLQEAHPEYSFARLQQANNMPSIHNFYLNQGVDELQARVREHNKAASLGIFEDNGVLVQVHPIEEILKVDGKPVAITTKKVEGEIPEDTDQMMGVVQRITGDRGVNNARITRDENGREILVPFDVTDFNPINITKKE